VIVAEIGDYSQHCGQAFAGRYGPRTLRSKNTSDPKCESEVSDLSNTTVRISTFFTDSHLSATMHRVTDRQKNGRHYHTKCRILNECFKVNSAFHPSGVGKSSTSLHGWG